jgi:hypothetical protein
MVFECNKVGSQKALSFVYCAVHYSALHKLPHITTPYPYMQGNDICIGFMQMLGKSETDGFFTFLLHSKKFIGNMSSQILIIDTRVNKANVLQ